MEIVTLTLEVSEDDAHNFRLAAGPFDLQTWMLYWLRNQAALEASAMPGYRKITGFKEIIVSPDKWYDANTGLEVAEGEKAAGK